MALKEKPDAWSRVDSVLESSANAVTKVFALSLLDDAIQCRWKSLPKEQREAIRTYIIGKILAVRRCRWCAVVPNACVKIDLRW